MEICDQKGKWGGALRKPCLEWTPCITLDIIIVSYDIVKVWCWKFKIKDYEIQEAEHSGWTTNDDKACLWEVVEEGEQIQIKWKTFCEHKIWSKNFLQEKVKKRKIY